MNWPNGDAIRIPYAALDFASHPDHHRHHVLDPTIHKTEGRVSVVCLVRRPTDIDRDRVFEHERGSLAGFELEVAVAQVVGDEDGLLRGRINAGLDVVEAWNGCNQIIFFGKGGDIATTAAPKPRAGQPDWRFDGRRVDPNERMIHLTCF